MRLKAETYVTAKGPDTVEYGFTFKKKKGEPDSEFDLVLGEARAGQEPEIEQAWRDNMWAANAIVEAAAKRGGS